MARKAERAPGGKVIGRRGGEPEWSRLERAEDRPGTETSTRKVSVACHCGTRVGELWLNEPADAQGEAYWSLLTTITEDADARPVKQRFTEQSVTPGASIPADCPAHGRLLVPADALLNRGRGAKGGQGSRLARYVFPRVVT